VRSQGALASLVAGRSWSKHVERLVSHLTTAPTEWRQTAVYEEAGCRPLKTASHYLVAPQSCALPAWQSQQVRYSCQHQPRQGYQCVGAIFCGVIMLPIDKRV
jgi:hypothetical protein